ncbi:MAG: ribosome silencing factor, partial [Dongiaceae bacterium]
KATLTTTDMLDLIEQSLSATKADNIVTLNLTSKSSLADFLVIASCASQRQLSAVAERIRDSLKDRGLRQPAVEGIPNCDWVVVDAGDVIVHLFKGETRQLYNLEKMWGVDWVETPAPVLA